jgi:hypothetical protein
MILAKYKKPLGIWLLFWCIWLVITASAWPMGKRYSPLLWPNVWGVIDWLGSSAIFVGIWLGAGHEFRRKLPKRNRFHDILMLLYFLARGFVLLALLFVVAAVRISLYRGEMGTTFAWFYALRPEPAVLRLPLIFCWLGIAPAIVAVLFGAISILFRKYDEPERIIPR